MGCHRETWRGFKQGTRSISINTAKQKQADTITFGTAVSACEARRNSVNSGTNASNAARSGCEKGDPRKVCVKMKIMASWSLCRALW